MHIDKPAGVHLWLIVMKAHQALEKYAVRSIEATGLCLSDFRTLEILLHKGPLPIHVLGEKLSLTSGALTAVVDRLEKRGYVERQLDPGDRRVRVIRLTESGTEWVRPAFEAHSRDMSEAISALDVAEQAQLMTLLKKLGKSAAYRLNEKGEM